MRRRRWWRWMIGAHAAALALLLAGRAWIVRLDHRIDRALYGRLSEEKEHVCYLLLQAGSSHVIALVGAVVALVLIVRRSWRRLIVWVVLLAGCVLLDATLKRIFHRPRPLNMEGWPGFSFPSGHVMAATAVYGMIAWFIGRAWAVMVAGAIVVVTAVALLLPGYHFLSDLIAGYFVGIAWLAGCATWARRWELSNRLNREIGDTG